MRKAFARRVNMVLLCGQYQNPFHTRLYFYWHNITIIIIIADNIIILLCDMTLSTYIYNTYLYIIIIITIIYYYDVLLVSAPLTAPVAPRVYHIILFLCTRCSTTIYCSSRYFALLLWFFCRKKNPYRYKEKWRLAYYNIGFSFTLLYSKDVVKTRPASAIRYRENRFLQQ